MWGQIVSVEDVQGHHNEWRCGLLLLWRFLRQEGKFPSVCFFTLICENLALANLLFKSLQVLARAPEARSIYMPSFVAWDSSKRSLLE